MTKICENGCIPIPPDILDALNWRTGDKICYCFREQGLFLYKKFLRSSPLFIRCFGHFSVEYEGKEICIQNKKMCEMLAFLTAYNNENINKWTIAQQLWPESTKTHAMDCLYKVLNCFIRSEHLSEKIPLEIFREQLRICLSPEESDISLFERLIHNMDSISSLHYALNLYRGNFLESECYEWSIVFQMKYELCFDLLRKKIKNMEKRR